MNASAPLADLPRLNPVLQLVRGEDSGDGTPGWVIYHPVSNRYFKIGWAEFECLSRLHECRTAAELAARVREQTTLIITEQDVQTLIAFLRRGGLLAGSASQSETPREPEKSFWQNLLHHYLFFTIPLLRPQAFLKRTAGFSSFLFSGRVFAFCLVMLFVFSILTLQRLDEFSHTFFQLLSLEGLVLSTIVFITIKICHEFGHAYAAARKGIAVPHMGVAFMVLYPVLYTETTGVWRLKSRKDRMAVGLAGVRVEIMLASLALMLWHVLPPGTAQSLCFSVVAISLVGSLLINLNPLMRFDGYYVLSDYLGIENLHKQATDQARFWLRKKLFGLEPPDSSRAARRHFLLLFGWAVLIYRFFLFIGIALLVYHLFFAPLGLILMIVELGAFIVWPVWGELKIWWQERRRILKNRRGRIAALCGVLCVCVLIVPWQTTKPVAAILHAANEQQILSSAPARIQALSAQPGQSVEAGDILVTLQSPQLEQNLKRARLKRQSLTDLVRRDRADPDLFRDRGQALEEALEQTRREVEKLEADVEALTVRANFSGVIVDQDPDLRPGQFVTAGHMMMRLINPAAFIVTAYLPEGTAQKIQPDSRAVFFTKASPFSNMPVRLRRIEAVNVSRLEWPVLSSLYGGPIASEPFTRESGVQDLVPRQSLYAATFEPVDIKADAFQYVTRDGTLFLSLPATSLLQSGFQHLGKIVAQELKLN